MAAMTICRAFCAVLRRLGRRDCLQKSIDSGCIGRDQELFSSLTWWSYVTSFPHAFPEKSVFSKPLAVQAPLFNPVAMVQEIPWKPSGVRRLRLQLLPQVPLAAQWLPPSP